MRSASTVRVVVVVAVVAVVVPVVPVVIGSCERPGVATTAAANTPAAAQASTPRTNETPRLIAAQCREKPCSWRCGQGGLFEAPSLGGELDDHPVGDPLDGGSIVGPRVVGRLGLPLIA
jgi:hypothetical protein